MFEYLSIQMILYQALMFGFVETHQRHLRSIASGDTYITDSNEPNRLLISGRMGQICGALLLLWLGFSAHWYSPIIVFLAALIPSGMIFGTIESKFIGAYRLSKISYFAWPISALFMAFEIYVIKA